MMIAVAAKTPDGERVDSVRAHVAERHGCRFTYANHLIDVKFDIIMDAEASCTRRKQRRNS